MVVPCSNVSTSEPPNLSLAKRQEHVVGSSREPVVGLVVDAAMVPENGGAATVSEYASQALRMLPPTWEEDLDPMYPIDRR